MLKRILALLHHFLCNICKVQEEGLIFLVDEIEFLLQQTTFYWGKVGSASQIPNFFQINLTLQLFAAQKIEIQYFDLNSSSRIEILEMLITDLALESFPITLVKGKNGSEEEVNTFCIIDIKNKFHHLYSISKFLNRDQGQIFGSGAVWQKGINFQLLRLNLLSFAYREPRLAHSRRCQHSN